MTLLITYVLIALGFSFLCSLLEATLLSLTPAAIHAAGERGAPWAKKMAELKADIDRPLSAILTLNTVAHTMGAAGAGAQYARLYGNTTEAVFAGILTLAILVFTEIIPKTLGARYALFFAGPTAAFLPILQVVLAPLVWLAAQITRLITLGKAHPLPMHREELIASAQMGERDGALRAEESAIVSNILKLHEVKVSSIMTPRTVIFMLSADLPLGEFAKQISDKPFSRIPVYGKTRDDISGFVLRSDVLQARLANPTGEALVTDLIRKIDVIPDHLTADVLFQNFLSSSQHVALVTNEFGTTTGIVTLEDVLETIVGVEIVDEKDQVADLQELARSLWKTRAEKMGIDLESPSE